MAAKTQGLGRKEDRETDSEESVHEYTDFDAEGDVVSTVPISIQLLDGNLSHNIGEDRIQIDGDPPPPPFDPDEPG